MNGETRRRSSPTNVAETRRETRGEFVFLVGSDKARQYLALCRPQLVRERERERDCTLKSILIIVESLVKSIDIFLLSPADSQRAVAETIAAQTNNEQTTITENDKSGAKALNGHSVRIIAKVIRCFRSRSSCIISYAGTRFPSSVRLDPCTFFLRASAISRIHYAH